MAGDAADASFTIHRGEDLNVQITMSPVIDITGWAITFTMRKQIGYLPIAVQKTVGFGVTLTDPTNGIFVVHLDSADTKNLDLGNYFYDIEHTDPGARRVIVEGTITLIPMVNPPA